MMPPSFVAPEQSRAERERERGALVWSMTGREREGEVEVEEHASWGEGGAGVES